MPRNRRINRYGSRTTGGNDPPYVRSSGRRRSTTTTWTNGMNGTTPPPVYLPGSRYIWAGSCWLKHSVHPLSLPFTTPSGDGLAAITKGVMSGSPNWIEVAVAAAADGAIWELCDVRATTSLRSLIVDLKIANYPIVLWPSGSICHISCRRSRSLSQLLRFATRPPTYPRFSGTTTTHNLVTPTSAFMGSLADYEHGSRGHGQITIL